MTIKLDAAIDDYLLLITHTRPWTKAREEEQLLLFSRWLGAQQDSSGDLAELSLMVSERYARSTGLCDAEHDDLDATLRKLMLWAEIRGLVGANAFTSRTTPVSLGATPGP